MSTTKAIKPIKVHAIGALKLIALSSSSAEVQDLCKFVFDEFKRVEAERDAALEALAKARGAK